MNKLEEKIQAQSIEKIKQTYVYKCLLLAIALKELKIAVVESFPKFEILKKQLLKDRAELDDLKKNRDNPIEFIKSL